MSTDVESLAEPLRTRVRALLNASGGKVTVLSARRTHEEQIELRRQNCGTTEYDIWQKPSGECNPETARPGQSKHETGEAVDFAGDLNLANQLAKPLGLKRTNSEPWHFEASGGGGIDIPGAAAIGAAVGAAGDVVSGGLTAVQAGAKFAGVLTRKETWLRVAAVLVGLVLVILGVSMILGDLGAIDGKGAANLVLGLGGE